VASFDDYEEKRRWRVKDTIYSPWRDLPGTHAGVEIWAMLNSGRFWDAMPVDEPTPNNVASDD
jgi:hypothetical protein